MLVDVVSKNGNLLINVGPKPDGSIPEIQMERLEELGAWMKLNGEAIYRTEPWEIAEYESASGTDLRFTKKEDCLYIHFFARPGKKELLSKLAFSEGCIVKLLGSDKELKWKQKNDAVEISFPVELPGKYVHVLEVSELPEFINSE